MPKRILTHFLAAAVVAAPTSVRAEVQTLDLLKELRGLKAQNIFEADPVKGPTRGGPAELKWRELRGEWKKCLALAARQNRNSEIQPWITLSRLNCAVENFASSSEGAEPLKAAFDAVKPAWLREGPWREALVNSWAQAGLQLVDLVERHPAAANKRLSAIGRQEDLLSKDLRAELLERWGDVSLRAGERDQAAFFFQRSLDVKYDAGIQARLAGLKKKLPLTAIVAAASNGAVVAEEVVPELPPVAIGGEAESEREVEYLMKQGKKADAVRVMVQVLSRYPAGRNAKKYRDRALELYMAAAEKGDAAEAEMLRTVMKMADPSRLAEWAGLCHRRGEDVGSQEFAEKALETMSGSPAATTLLYVAGRSAQFLGRWESASRHFDQLIQFHGSTDEAGEAQFRLGLVYLRQAQFQNAVKTFDKVLSSKARSKFELNAMYWRARALENESPDLAKAAREEIIKKFPFTYYGLRLKAERDGGVVEFSKSERSPLESEPARLWLVGRDQAGWKRFKILLAEGWLLEAQQELATLPTPVDPWGMLTWADLLAKGGQHPTAIVLANRALEADDSLRLPRYLEPMFPRSYAKLIETEATKNGLPPVLVKSLIRQESAFGLKAVSTSNAMGLMQMIPPTAIEIAKDLKMKVKIPDDMFRPEINVPMGTHYIAKMVREFDGTVPFALAAYNAGPQRMGRWVKQRPELNRLKGTSVASWTDEIWYDEIPWSETSFYVKAILRNLLLNRLIDDGRVEVGDAFWKELVIVAPAKSNDKAKRD